jgi:hypothetical protein
MKNMNVILFISIVKLLDNTVVFHKLAALRSSMVPHERTNATTEALVDELYNCRLTVDTFVFVTLCFSRIAMPKTTYLWKGRRVTKSTHEKRLAEQKSDGTSYRNSP